MKTMSEFKSCYQTNPQYGARVVEWRVDRNTDREYGGTPCPPPQQQGIQQAQREVGRVEVWLLRCGRMMDRLEPA